MTGLNSWLQQATRGLSKESATRVRNEIQQHFDLAREAAMQNGATADEAGGRAMATLGDPNATNCAYRDALLTAAEARLLREGNWEARAICSRPMVKWLLLGLPVTALAGAAFLFSAGAGSTARLLLAFGIVMGLLFGAPFLPIYTPSRSRIFRLVKWSGMSGALVLAFGPHTLQSSSLLFACAWPVAWIEWKRASIRRKLRVADWPKQLYL